MRLARSRPFLELIWVEADPAYCAQFLHRLDAALIRQAAECDAVIEEVEAAADRLRAWMQEGGRCD